MFVHFLCQFLFNSSSSSRFVDATLRKKKKTPRRSNILQMLWRFLSKAVISLFQSNNSFALKGQITGELSYLNEALNYCFSESGCAGKVKMKHTVLMLSQMYSTVLNYIAHKYDKCDEQLIRFLYKSHQIGWDPSDWLSMYELLKRIYSVCWCYNVLSVKVLHWPFALHFEVTLSLWHTTC